MEAEAGIEPTYTDLQSAASPLCHSARDLEFKDLQSGLKAAERRVIEALTPVVKHPAVRMELGLEVTQTAKLAEGQRD